MIDLQPDRCVHRCIFFQWLIYLHLFTDLFHKDFSIHQYLLKN